MDTLFLARIRRFIYLARGRPEQSRSAAYFRGVSYTGFAAHLVHILATTEVHQAVRLETRKLIIAVAQLDCIEDTSRINLQVDTLGL